MQQQQQQQKKRPLLFLVCVLGLVVGGCGNQTEPTVDDTSSCGSGIVGGSGYQFGDSTYQMTVLVQVTCAGPAHIHVSRGRTVPTVLPDSGRYWVRWTFHNDAPMDSMVVREQTVMLFNGPLPRMWPWRL